MISPLHHQINIKVKVLDKDKNPEMDKEVIDNLFGRPDESFCIAP